MIFKKLFEPVNINRLTVKNRIIMPAITLVYTDNYSFNDRHKAFYRERANGGVGLMIMGPMAIDRVGSAPFMPGIFDDSQIGSIRDFANEVRGNCDVRIGLQLMQMGRYGSSRFTGTVPLAPSAIPNPITGETPRPMTEDNIEEVKKAFVDAAVRAKEACVDYIELMAGGGYLIGGFLSPLTNRRTDRYGGSLENRMRFGLEVIKSVRAALGSGFPLGIRVSGHDFVNGGNTSVESALFCVEAEKAGVDCINVTGGWHESQVPQITGDVPPGAFVYLARAVKEKVQVPVFASNRLGNPYLAEKVLRSGSADMICWGRPLIADPELPDKARSGRLNEVVPCLSCNQACLDALFNGGAVSCVLNPRAGREANTIIKGASTKKRILVAGGGPAGMEFALIAAQRGHDVTLYEKSEKLGGQMNLIGAIPGKTEFLLAVASLRNRMHIAGAKVVLNVALTTEIVENQKPDVLVVSTGARPAASNIAKDHPAVLAAWDVLNGTASDIGKRVVIVGGGATGCEVATFLSSCDTISSDVFTFLSYHATDHPDSILQLLYRGSRKVTVIDIAGRLATNVGPSTRWPLMKHLKLLGVALRPNTRIIRVTADAVLVESDGRQESIPADTVIIATGSVSFDELSSRIKQEGTEVIKIGDANTPRKVTEAIRDAFDAAMKI